MNIRRLTSIILVCALAAGCVAAFSACSVINNKNPIEDLYILSPYKRYSRFGELDETGKTALEITLAKNEREGGQIALRSSTTIYKNVKLSVSDLVCEKSDATLTADNLDLYREDFVATDISTWPHIREGAANLLVPLSYKDLNLYNTVLNENLLYYIRVSTPSDAVAGEYRGTVTVVHDDGKFEIPLNVTVLDLCLPTRPSLRSDCLYWDNFTRRIYGDRITDNQARAMFNYVRDTLRENKLTLRNTNDFPSFWSYGVGHEDEYAQAVKKFLEEHPTVNCFDIPIQWINWDNGVVNTEVTLPIINALRNADLLEYGIVTSLDEPHTPGEYYALRNTGEWFKNNAPDVNVYMTTFPGQVDMSIVHSDDIDIWCAVIGYIDVGVLREYQKNGAKFWGYGFEKTPAKTLNQIRLIGWELMKYGMKGYEDWCVNSYTSSYDEVAKQWIIDWNAAYQYSYLFPSMEGDGLTNRNMLITTFALEGLRDAAEDYEYVILLEKQVQKKLTELGVDITLDKAMEEYYDGQMLDVHRHMSDKEDEFEVLRNRALDEIFNGVDFIVTSTDEPTMWEDDFRYIHIYADKDDEILVNGKVVEKTEYETYDEYTIFVLIPDDGYNLTVTCNGKDTSIHFACDYVEKAAILDYNDAELESALRTANPRADFEIVEVDGQKTLKINFNADISRGFRIPVSVMKALPAEYTDIRFRMWSDSDDNTAVPYFSLASSFANFNAKADGAPTTDKSTIFTASYLQKEAVPISPEVKTMTIRLDDTSKDVTIWFTTPYYVNTSNEFSWVIVDE